MRKVGCQKYVELWNTLKYFFLHGQCGEINHESEFLFFTVAVFWPSGFPFLRRSLLKYFKVISQASLGSPSEVLWIPPHLNPEPDFWVWIPVPAPFFKCSGSTLLDPHPHLEPNLPLDLDPHSKMVPVFTCSDLRSCQVYGSKSMSVRSSPVSPAVHNFCMHGILRIFGHLDSWC